jgi:hypothetical protein
VNYYEAHRILNEVKDGIDHPTELISHALYLTGDLEDGVRGETLPKNVQPDEVRAWPRSRFWMVGPNNI